MVRWGMIRLGIEDYEVLRLLQAKFENMSKDPSRSKDVAEIQETLKQAVEAATKAGTVGDLCSTMSNIGYARAP